MAAKIGTRPGDRAWPSRSATPRHAHGPRRRGDARRLRAAAGLRLSRQDAPRSSSRDPDRHCPGSIPKRSTARSAHASSSANGAAIRLAEPFLASGQFPALANVGKGTHHDRKRSEQQRDDHDRGYHPPHCEPNAGKAHGRGLKGSRSSCLDNGSPVASHRSGGSGSTGIHGSLDLAVFLS